MASYPQIKIRHSPMTSYPGTAPTSFVGAQTTPGQRGTLPSFTDGNAYWFSSYGSDNGFGISGSPWRNLSKIFGTSPTWADSSGNGYDLIPTTGGGGTALPQILTYPCAPKPPRGTSAVMSCLGAPKSAASPRVLGPAALMNAMKSKTQYTFESWFLIPNQSAPIAIEIFSMAASGGSPTPTQLVAGGGGNGPLQWQSPIGSFNSGTWRYEANRWYYVAVIINSGVSNGSQILVGDSPETLSVVGTGTVTGGVSTSYNIIGLGGARCYLARPVLSTAIRTQFPTKLGAANIQGLWRLSTPCLMESSPRPYVVLTDSGTWNEGIYCPWIYDMTNAFDVYALDGAAPTIELGRGVKPQSYGPNYVGYNSIFTPNYFINQITGNDATGARGNPSKPFKTIQAALSDSNVNDGDIFELRDNSFYKETLTFPAGKQDLTLRATPGKTPIVAPGAYGATQATLPNPAGTYQFKNITFEGYSPTYGSAMFYGSSGVVSVAMDACAVKNFSKLGNQAFGAINLSIASTNNAFSNVAELLIGGSYVNCYFHNQAPPGTYVNMNGPITQATFRLCTFDNTQVNWGPYFEGNKLDQCLFVNCKIYADKDSRIYQTSALTNSTLDQSLVWLGGDGTNFLFENCQQFSDSLNLAAGFHCEVSATPGAGAGNITQVLNCSAIRNQVNFDFPSVFHIMLSHCTSVASSTGGFKWYFDTSGTGYYSAVSTALVSAGDAVAALPAAIGTTSFLANIEANALITSQTLGSENITLQAQDGGIFNAGDGFTDAGVDFVSWDLPQNTIVNGLIFAGPINGEAALGSNYGATIKAAFCTFNGLGTYAMRGSDQGGAQNCLFQTNGHAFKNNGANAYVNGSIGNSCGGAFILNIGQGLLADHDTTFLCQYGIYEVPSSTAGSITNSIFSGSALYDYSGPNVLSYCCASSLNPDSVGYLDANSLSVDPLFFAPLNSDLRLQSPAIGNFYTSPCVNADNAGGNMGALAYTYGPATTTWTLLDFGAQDVYGNFYRNPDRVVRKELPIKLAEGDRENGAIFSVAATFKREYEFTWEQNTNDMPQAQVVDMLNMFTSFTNELQVDFGLGLGWTPGYFARQNGFEWTDMTGFYSDSAQPTPVRSLTIREA